MLRKFKRWLRFRRHDDAYATTKQSLWQSVQTAIQVQLGLGKAVWVVTHFPDTFLAYQNLLSDSSIDYNIAQHSLNPSFLQNENKNNESLKHGQVSLVLSALIPPIDDDPSRTFDESLAVLVVERHPLIDHDQRIQEYCKRIGATVELGYFQSFEDPIVADELNEMTVTLMEQMGLNDHSLINSMTLTRRIDRKLKRLRKRYPTDIAADNIQQWYNQNKVDSATESDWRRCVLRG